MLDEHDGIHDEHGTDDVEASMSCRYVSLSSEGVGWSSIII